MDNILNDLQEPELFIDSKTTLQELVQHLYPGKPFSYEILSENGPEHDKEFDVAVFIDGQKISEGKGKTKRAAQQMAASAAISIIKEQEKA